jgi:transcriptional regulator with XRE-family HTH domain
VQPMAARRTIHDEDSVDFYVIAEIRVAMLRAELQRAMAGEVDSKFTVAELADMIDGMTAEQLGRRFRGESGVTLNDLERLAEALEIEPWALLRAALMRKRNALGTPPKQLRDQVIEGPGGLPIIQ